MNDETIRHHGDELYAAWRDRRTVAPLTERAPVLQHFRHLGPDIINVDPGQVGLTVLHDLQVDYVVLDRYKMPGGLEREYTSALAQAIFGNRAPLFEDERLTVYQMPAVDSVEPYIVLGPLNWGPYQQAEDRQFRTLLEGPATVQVYHVQPAQMALHIRYRTSPDAVLQVYDSHGNAQVYSPAPTGAELVLPLLQYGILQADGSLIVKLQGTGLLRGVEIEEVRLGAP